MYALKTLNCVHREGQFSKDKPNFDYKSKWLQFSLASQILVWRVSGQNQTHAPLKNEEGIITTMWYRGGVWNINGMHMLNPDPDRYAISDYQYHMWITAKHHILLFWQVLRDGMRIAQHKVHMSSVY